MWSQALQAELETCERRIEQDNKQWKVRLQESKRQPRAPSTALTPSAPSQATGGPASQPLVITVPGASPVRRFATPPERIPDDLLSEFTLDGKINYVAGPYFNDQNPEGQAEGAKVVHYAKDRVDSLMLEVAAGRGAYYGETDMFLYWILNRHPDIIRGKEVAILGSLEPWYEAVALQYGAASVTTIEYGPRTTDDPRLSFLTPAEFAASPRQFDVALSISSFEHDGE